MTAPTPSALRRSRIQLILLALVFLGPVGLSFWMYYGAHFKTAKSVAHGELLQPARPTPEASLATPSGQPTAARFLRGKWSLVYLAGEQCGADCVRDLAQLRNVRLAMDRERDRVQRVLLGLPPCCAPAELAAAAGTDLVVGWIDSLAGRRLLAPFPGESAAARAGRVYVVDPLGNLVISYPAGAERKGLIKDLEKLLRLSHIG
jgi:cytochrome oxidase Cu insertion factor (SCO1/SenC/PrrC family)